jgi:integrase/transcription elongation factor Elf1
MSVWVKKREERNRESKQQHTHIHTLTHLIRCPECGSVRLYRAGLRYLSNGETIQRWLCRNCGYRFSKSNVKINVSGKSCKTLDSRTDLLDARVFDSNFSREESLNDFSFSGREDVASHKLTVTGKGLNRFPSYNRNQQVCAQKDAKNLNPTSKIENTLGVEKNHLKSIQQVKGKIVELLVYMKRQGYAESTIRLNRIALKVLWERGADLSDPDSVKDVIASQKAWSQDRKRNVINAYTLFLKIQGFKWEKPKVKISRGFPFIPKEEELDSLIAGSGKKNASFLQTLKETAMRSGEAKRLMWINIDLDKNTITLNSPEKGSNPRMWKVSSKLIAMLNALPRNSEKVFGESSLHSMKTTFIKSRKRLSIKLQNPRLLRISFHTFRHWKATMLYHKTKDPYYVKNFLGHKSLKSTEIYINIEHTLFEPSDDAFTVKVAEKSEDVKALLEIGFEYVCQKDNLIFLRKRK